MVPQVAIVEDLNETADAWLLATLARNEGAEQVPDVLQCAKVSNLTVDPLSRVGCSLHFLHHHERAFSLRIPVRNCTS